MKALLNADDSRTLSSSMHLSSSICRTYVGWGRGKKNGWTHQTLCHTISCDTPEHATSPTSFRTHEATEQSM